MPRRKTRVISIRVNQAYYDILRDVSEELNKTVRNPQERFSIGDTTKMMLDYFIMAYTLGEWKEPLPNLRKRFMEFLKSFRKS